MERSEEIVSKFQNISYLPGNKADKKDFVSRKYEFNLEGHTMKHISLAYENNFVALTYALEENNHLYSFISIYAPQGQLLNRFRMMKDEERKSNKFWMLRNDQIIFPCYDLKQVAIISLKNHHQKRIIPFKAAKQGSVSIHTFPQSDLFCIILKERVSNRQRLTVKYYQYRGVAQQSQLVFQFKDTSHFGVNRPRKIDNRSKIAWELVINIQSEVGSYFQLKQYYDLCCLQQQNLQNLVSLIVQTLNIYYLEMNQIHPSISHLTNMQLVHPLLYPPSFYFIL